MQLTLAKVGSALAGLLLAATLVACGDSTQATSKSLLTGTATPTAGSAATATSDRPGIGGPPATTIFSRPSGTTILQRPTGTPDLPILGGRPTETPSANAVAPNSDGSCPDTHPIKAAMIGPIKNYFLKDQAGYSNARATECFATEADAEAAGYRKAGR